MLHPQLITFIKVVESGSFAKAAPLCFCSPVAVMNQINALEDRLQVQLLLRSTQGVKLTQAGKSFYDEAKEIIKFSENAVARAREIAKPDISLVRFGTSFLRPCKPLLDYLEKTATGNGSSFQIKIVTFDDSPEEFSLLQKNLGKEIDCFVSPCDSEEWNKKFQIYQLGVCKCCISLSKKHPLAVKKSLTWTDMAGESLILVQKGISPVIDQLRAEIETYHPEIKIIDSPRYYDVDIFNHCEQTGHLLEVPEFWRGIHPALLTLPVEWDYAMPYGVVYSMKPTAAFEKFIASLG